MSSDEGFVLGGRLGAAWPLIWVVGSQQDHKSLAFSPFALNCLRIHCRLVHLSQQLCRLCATVSGQDSERGEQIFFERFYGFQLSYTHKRGVEMFEPKHIVVPTVSEFHPPSKLFWLTPERPIIVAQTRGLRLACSAESCGWLGPFDNAECGGEVLLRLLCMH